MSSEQYSYEYQYQYEYQETAKMEAREDSGSGLAKALASKMGSAGAKWGKKAAQSEAGRRATKAAVSGACDAVKDDMIARYSESDTTPTTPSEKKISTEQKPEKEKVNTVPSWVDSGDEDDDAFEPSRREPAQSWHAPPKPSLKDKFKLNIHTSKSKSLAPPRKRPPVKKDPKDRVYSSRLAKTPDWEKLPRAQALYNYKAEMKCDLEFRKGQIIHVITRTDNQNDWWEGKLEERVGIFPANYVKMLF